jgi:dUTP pyrophosphatase
VILSPGQFAFPGSPAPELQLQPAGYDLTVRCVERFVGPGSIDLTNARRSLPELGELPWESVEPCDESVMLEQGGYLITYNEEIAIPRDAAAIVLPRSSLMRCGAVLHSALWDPGYRGRGQGLLTVFSSLRLYKDARVGQIVYFAMQSAAAKEYAGVYQGENP